MDRREFDKVVAETPLGDHRLKLAALRGDGFSAKEFADAYARMDHVYDPCESALAEGPWLAGAQYTLADIALLPYIDGFKDIRPELMTSHPRIAAWHARIMARPAVKATYEPSEEAPARRPVAA